MDIISSLLKNKYFWIGLAILIVLIIIHRQWPIIKSKLFEQKNPSYATDENGDVIKVTQLDQSRLDKMVVDTRTAITKLTGMEYGDVDTLLALTDQELEYVTKKYKASYSTSLYEDVNDEYMPFTNKDEELMARLDKIGYK